MTPLMVGGVVRDAVRGVSVCPGPTASILGISFRAVGCGSGSVAVCSVLKGGICRSRGGGLGGRVGLGLGGNVCFVMVGGRGSVFGSGIM